MSRKKLIRHFDARVGVSREMVDTESVYVTREHEDYLTLATNDMRQKLHELRGKWSEADQTAEKFVRCLPEREALAFQCLLVRDLFLVLELYGSCMRKAVGDVKPVPIPAAPAVAAASPTSAHENRKTLPFSEWLFEPSH